MFCPHCGLKLEDGITVCPDCQTEIPLMRQKERVIRKMSIDQIKDKEEDTFSEERVVAEPEYKMASKTMIPEIFAEEQDVEDTVEDTIETSKEISKEISKETFQKSSQVDEAEHYQSYQSRYDPAYGPEYDELDDEYEYDDDDDFSDLDDEYDDDDYDDYDDYDDDDDDDDDIVRTAQSLKKRKKRKKRSNGMIAAISVGIVFILLICAVAAVFFLKWFRGTQYDALNEKFVSYASALQEYDSDFGEYKALYEKTKDALNHKEYSSFAEISKEIDEMLEKIINSADEVKNLTQLKDEYTTVYGQYVITEDYKATYDDLMKRLDEAITTRQEMVASDLKKELESLKTNLHTSNQQLLQKKLNEINAIDVAKASEHEKSKLDEFQDDVNQSINDNNYVEALRVIGLWKDFAVETQKSIRESEEAEQKKREEERLAIEESEKQAVIEESIRQEQAAQQTQQTQAPAQPQQPKPQPSVQNSGYIFPNSSSQYLTSAQVNALSAYQKRIARNEIYARHGRIFKDAELDRYFRSQSWYKPTISADNFSDSLLNAVEKKNINLIKSLE